MLRIDIPLAPFDESKETDMQAAYRIAGALTKGGLSRVEQGMVVHEWCAHMKRVICPDNPKIPTPRRWK